MSNRDAVKFLGFALLVVFGFMAATPFIAVHTSFYNTTGNFKWVVVGLTLVSLTHDVNGMPIGTASAISGVFALIGVALMVGVSFFAPVRANRHVITHRQ